jgi:hypothetical protein
MRAGKRVRRIVLIASGSVVAAAVIAAAGLYIYAAIDKEDGFYLVKAEPSDPTTGCTRRYPAPRVSLPVRRTTASSSRRLQPEQRCRRSGLGGADNEPVLALLARAATPAR